MSPTLDCRTNIAPSQRPVCLSRASKTRSNRDNVCRLSHTNWRAGVSTAHKSPKMLSRSSVSIRFAPSKSCRTRLIPASVRPNIAIPRLFRFD